MKKIKKLKVNNLLKYWNYLNFLRTNGILIFCQNLSLNAFNDFKMSAYFNDLNYKWKIINKNIIKKFLDKKIIMRVKKFNNILIIKDLNEIKELELYLKKKKVLILGYYIQNIFFFKKDFEIKNMEKKKIVYNIKKKIFKLYTFKTNFIIFMKLLLIKFILLLKKKNGNN